jgi:hypothetical protein
VEKAAYEAVFKTEANDSAIEVSAYGVPLKIKPLRLKSGNVEVPADTSDLRYGGEDRVEYVRLFAGKGKIEYLLEDRRLKESIIFEDITDFSSLGGETSTSTSTEGDQIIIITPETDEAAASPLASSTVSMEFSLVYPEEAVLSIDGDSGWDGSTVTTGGDIAFIQKKEPHTLYSVNTFYSIQAPYLTDADKKRVDLTYTLEKRDDQTLLRLNIPPLNTLRFPIVVDPTVNFSTSNGFVWMNENTCSTESYSCSNYGSGAMQFFIPQNCNVYGHQIPVKKPLFRFNTSGLHGKYTGNLDLAEIYVAGTCIGKSQLRSGETVRLFEIENFSGNPGVEGYQDDKYRDNITRLMSTTICDSSGWYDITDNFNYAVTGAYNITFKVDVHPPRNSTDNPPTNDIYYNVSYPELAIRYAYRCSTSSNCPSWEFCNASSTHLCQPDLNFGDYCQGVAADNDSLSCSNNNCKLDDYDNIGKFCAESSKCVNDGNRYDSGYVHCNNTYGYKTCQPSTYNWSSYTTCSLGCNETIGCVTTTTLPSHMVVAPQEIMITIIK